MRLECKKCGYLEPQIAHEEILTCDCDNIKSETLKQTLRRVDEFFKDRKGSEKNNDESV